MRNISDWEIHVEYQSVLVILVPEAEPLVGPFRSKYDSSTAVGMPAHITINYPFLPVEKDKTSAVSKLKSLFSEHESFQFSLAAVKRLPGLLYLEPFPTRPFTELIRAVPERFPQSPPYGGIFKEVIPHLTVATTDDNEALEEINRQFTGVCVGRLPMRASARDVWLMDNGPGLWTTRISFALAEQI